MLSLLFFLLAAPAFPLGAENAPVKNPDTLIFSPTPGAELVSFDPAYPYDAVSPGIYFNVYETLIGFEGERNDRFVPLLAASVPSAKNGLISQDGLVYRFPIRKHVRFHDGTIMTAADVRYSLLRFMLTDPAGGPASLLLEPILGVTGTRDAKGNLQVSYDDAARAVGLQGDSVVIRLKRPFAPFLSIMAGWSYVLSRNAAKAHGQWDGAPDTWQRYNNPAKESSWFYDHADGTGPFELERWDRQGRRIYLKRFDRYWRRPARLKRVVIATVPEFQTQKLMLEAGDADIIEPPRPYLSQVAGLPGVRIADGLPRLRTDPVLFFTLRINPLGNPDIGSGRLDGEGIPPDFFQDKDLRQAFSYAFDYDAFLKDTMKGSAKRAIGPVPPALLGYNPNGPRYELNLLEATNHFQRAWGGKVWRNGFKFTITYNTGSEERETPCRILKKNVESINPKFRVDVRGVDWPSFLDKAQKHMMPIFSRGWVADYPDPHNFVFAFYHSQGRYPSAQGFGDPDMDALIDEALREVDPVKRERLYWKIQEKGYDEAPDILTAYMTGAYALRTWVRGFYDNAAFKEVYFYPLSKGYEKATRIE